MSLETTLRELVERDRATLATLFFTRFKRNIQNFIVQRGPRQTEYSFWEGYIPFLRDVTNYKEWIHRSLPFEVRFNDDADQKLMKFADAEATACIDTFVARAKSKLQPFIDRVESYSLSVNSFSSGFTRGAWTGQLLLLSPVTNATITLKIITNFSKFGEPYAQYPMTFGNGLSVEGLWALVGYKAPKAPPAPRWKKLVPGSVVLVDGSPLLIQSPKNFTGTAKQVARIEASETGYRIERADRSVLQHKWTPEQVSGINTDLSYNKLLAHLRQLAFLDAFSKLI
jgi:hypothetical protein